MQKVIKMAFDRVTITPPSGLTSPHIERIRFIEGAVRFCFWRYGRVWWGARVFGLATGYLRRYIAPVPLSYSRLSQDLILARVVSLMYHLAPGPLAQLVRACDS